MRAWTSVPTTDSAVDARFLKQFVLLNGAVPLALLGWDAAHGRLGVNPARASRCSTACYDWVMAETITQRELRNDSGEIFFMLTDVCAKCNHIKPLFAQPFENDGSIKTSRVGEDEFGF